MTCTLLLIRHGETDRNRDGRYQGHVDPPLNKTGQTQARQLEQALRTTGLDAIYSSDLQRALETAAPLSDCRGLLVQSDPRLRELNFGQWDGRLVAEVMDTDRAAWNTWWADPVRHAPPGGETVPALWHRFGASLREIEERHSGGTVAVVTHGGPLRLVLAWMTHGRLHPPAQQSIANGGWLLLTAGVAPWAASLRQ